MNKQAQQFNILPDTAREQQSSGPRLQISPSNQSAGQKFAEIAAERERSVHQVTDATHGSLVALQKQLQQISPDFQMVA